MSKLEIQMPGSYPFSAEIPVRFMDVRNAALKGINVSHAVFDMYLSFINEAFDLFLDKYGFSKLNIAGKNMTVANSSIVYKGEMNPGDLIKVQVAPANFEEKSCDLFFLLTKQNDSIEVARARIGILFFDYAEKKSVPVPDGFKSLFN